MSKLVTFKGECNAEEPHVYFVAVIVVILAAALSAQEQQKPAQPSGNGVGNFR